MQQQDPVTKVDADEVAALARVAELKVPADRLPALTEQMNQALQAASELAAAARSTSETGTNTFDPSWPNDGKRRQR